MNTLTRVHTLMGIKLRRDVAFPSAGVKSWKVRMEAPRGTGKASHICGLQGQAGYGTVSLGYVTAP